MNKLRTPSLVNFISRSFTAAARSVGQTGVPHVKHKIPSKRFVSHLLDINVHANDVIKFCLIYRASKLMGILQQEELSRLKNGREWEQILPGDSIQIEKLPYMSAPDSEMEIVKGVVIAKTNKLADSRITFLNVRHSSLTSSHESLCTFSNLCCFFYFVDRASLERLWSAVCACIVH